MARWSDFIDDFQLVNEFKGFPALVGIDIDLAAANQWWDTVGSPASGPTMVDVAGEGITETYEYALKQPTLASGDGCGHTWTYADEPRVKSGRTMSAMCAVWVVGGNAVTAKLVNSDSSETEGDVTWTSAAWGIIKIEGHTLAGTSCKFEATLSGAGTFYVVPLGASIGPTAMPLGPRPTRYVPSAVTDIVSAASFASTDWVDCDLTANTNPLCYMAETFGYSKASGSSSRFMYVRTNGSSDGPADHQFISSGIVDVWNITLYRPILLDDAQIFEYAPSSTEVVQAHIHLVGYREWA